MADTKVPDLTELTSISVSDQLYIVDVSDTTDSSDGTSKFITQSNLLATQTSPAITSPVLTTPQINDTSSDHQYVFAVSELTADRTITLPLLTGNDTFVFEAHTQTLTNKTLTTPTITTPTINDANGNELLKFASNTSAVNEITIENSATGVNPKILATGEADTGITFENDQSEEILVLDAVAGAVNEITIKNAATGVFPKIQATGEVDTGINFENSEGEEGLIIDFIATAVNELTIKNAVAGSEPIIEATGGDTDVGITLTPKGAGEVNITAGDLNLSGTTPNVQIGGADPDMIITLPAAAWKPTTTAGCAALTTVEAGTNDIDYDVLDFDTSTDENAFVNFQMPTNWDGGVIQFRYVWTNAGGGAAETVTWELSGRSYADNDAIDQAVGTAVELADTWIAQGDVHISSFSGDVTLAGSPAGGQWVHLEIMRDTSVDDLTGDARLMGVQIKYKIAQYSN